MGEPVEYVRLEDILDRIRTTHIELGKGGLSELPIDSLIEHLRYNSTGEHV